ncbi:MAG: sugar phosphate isomerase/epimerase [Firmicutes bacterium]|nr:sugar phosphate isomerase/epimerase [Bacillota bacterium]
MKPEIVLTSRASGGDFKTAAQVARELGFDGIDWNLDYFRIAAASNARQAFYDAARSAGVPSGFHGPCHDIELGHKDPRIAKTAVHYLKMYIDFIKAFQGTHMTLHIGSRSISMEEMSWENALLGLKEVAAYGREQGVVICLENLKQGWASEPERLAKLAEYSGASITLDIGHARGSAPLREGRVTLGEYIRPFAHRIRNLHVYEIETLAGKHQEPTSLDNIGPCLKWALEQGITWWVIELDDYDAMLRVKHLLELGLDEVAKEVVDLA